MGYSIEDIQGIGPTYGEKLQAAGIKTTDDFLELCCDTKGRKAVAEKTGITEKLVLTWANLADLMRISGIGPQYSELLEKAGVDTVKELKQRRADNLAAKMAEINASGSVRISGAVPNDKVVSGWIEEAKKVEPRITH